jgi:hypothetical protein
MNLVFLRQRTRTGTNLRELRIPVQIKDILRHEGLKELIYYASGRLDEFAFNPVRIYRKLMHSTPFIFLFRRPRLPTNSNNTRMSTYFGPILIVDSPIIVRESPNIPASAAVSTHAKP